MRPVSLHAVSPLYYEESGTGEPLVLLHGMGCDQRIWNVVRADLNTLCHMFTPDLPGHGQSPKLRGRYDLEFYAATVARWLDALSLGPVHVVGHSLGGAVAIMLALERPDLVRSVGAVSAVRLAPHRLPGRVLAEFMAFGLSQLLGRPSRGAVRRFLHNGFGVPPGRITPEMVQLFQESAAASTLAVLQTNRRLAGRESLLYSRLRQVQCPAWLLWGRLDPLYPGEDLVKKVAGRLWARVDYTECGHLPMLERPLEFVGHLLAHLEEVRQNQSGVLDEPSHDW